MSISVGCDPAVVCYSRDDVRYNRVTASGIFAYIREFCEQDVNVEWLACDVRHNMLEYFVRENVSENDSVLTERQPDVIVVTVSVWLRNYC